MTTLTRERFGTWQQKVPDQRRKQKNVSLSFPRRDLSLSLSLHLTLPRSQERAALLLKKARPQHFSKPENLAPSPREELNLSALTLLGEGGTIARDEIPNLNLVLFNGRITAVKHISFDSSEQASIFHNKCLQIRRANISSLALFLDVPVQDRVYVVQEPGEPLTSRSFSEDLKMRASVALQVAECIEALHQAGFSHGDVQPGHFMRITSANGEVMLRLMPLSLQALKASFTSDCPFHSRDLNYCAPEILRRYNTLPLVEAQGDAQSDVWSTAKFVTELLVHYSLTWDLNELDNEDAGCLSGWGEQRDQSLGQVRKLYSGPLAEVLERCLSPEPSARGPIETLTTSLKAL